MLRPIYVVRWNYAPERHLRKREGHQLTCSCQSKACAVDVNAHLGVHTAQGVENKELQTKMGRLAHRIHAKSAPQACRAGDKERCGLLCCVAQSLVPCMYRQRLPLVRTPWHHLSSYQSLVFGMYRQACSSYALLGTTSAATKAAVSSADSSSCGAVVLRPERLAGSVVVGAAGNFLHIPAVETRTRQPNKAPRRMGSDLFRASFAGCWITLPSTSSVCNNCAFSATR